MLVEKLQNIKTGEVYIWNTFPAGFWKPFEATIAEPSQNQAENWNIISSHKIELLSLFTNTTSIFG